jgi:small-conductance mechanosensitive channel
MPSLREFAKKNLPKPLVEWIRRRRALRLYLKELGYEIYYVQTRLDNQELEERIAARGGGAYGRLVKDVLERTDLLLQQLDRRIEGLNARSSSDLRDVRAAIEELRASVEELRAWRQASSSVVSETDRASSVGVQGPAPSTLADVPTIAGHAGE